MNRIKIDIKKQLFTKYKPSNWHKKYDKIFFKDFYLKGAPCKCHKTKGGIEMEYRSKIG